MKITIRSQDGVEVEMYIEEVYTIEIGADSDTPICFIEVNPNALPESRLMTVYAQAADKTVHVTSSMASMCFSVRGGG